MTETIWGYWLGEPGNSPFIPLPKLPLQRAGFTQAPFQVTRPDGKVLDVVELENLPCLSEPKAPLITQPSGDNHD